MNPQTNAMHQPLGPFVADWKVPPFPTGATLHGRYCRLEALDAERHARGLFAANALDESGACWTYLPYGPFPEFDDYRAWMAEHTRGRDPLFYAVIDLATEEAVGVASYLRIAPVSGTIEVGHLHFSPRLQRTRAATEAMSLMMAHAFELGYRRYEWKCDALNVPSRAAALRLGLSFEGVFRQAAIVKGRSRDTAWYAAINGEWPALRAAFARWLSPENFDAEGNQRIGLSALTAPIVNRGSPA